MHLTVLGQAIARLPPVILHVAMVYNGVLELFRAFFCCNNTLLQLMAALHPTTN